MPRRRRKPAAGGLRWLGVVNARPANRPVRCGCQSADPMSAYAGRMHASSTGNARLLRAAGACGLGIECHHQRRRIEEGHARRLRHPDFARRRQPMAEGVDLASDRLSDLVPRHRSNILEAVADLTAAETMDLDRLALAMILDELLQPPDAGRLRLRGSAQSSKATAPGSSRAISRSTNSRHLALPPRLVRSCMPQSIGERGASNRVNAMPRVESAIPRTVSDDGLIRGWV